MKKRIIILLAILMTGTTYSFGQEKYGKTPEEQQICKEAISIYQTQRKNKDEAVYTAWQKAMEVCPCKVSQRMYTDGVKFIKKEMKKSDDARKAVLIDSLYLIYDQRMENFPKTKKNPNNACSTLAYKANDMKRYSPEKMDQVIDDLRSVIECLGNKSLAASLSTYYAESYKKIAPLKETATDEALLEVDVITEDLLIRYLSFQDICDFNIKSLTSSQATEEDQKKKDKLQKKIDGYNKTKANIDAIFIVLAECDNMVPILQKQYDASPDDIEMMKKFLRLMNKKDCTDTPLYIEIAKKVCAKEPSGGCMYSIGIGYLKETPPDLKNALDHLEQAVELGAEDPDYERYVLRAAQVAGAKGNHSKARKYANKLLEINPNNGKALIIKADALRATAGSCDDGKLGRACVYLAAADAYARAKAKDPSVAKEANQKINQCKSGFPSTQELFEVGKKVGDTITCPCNGISTVVRKRD